MTADLQGAPVLLREQRGRVLVVTINRPDKGNALNQPVITALDQLASDVLEACASGRGDRPRALVLTGAGDRAFSAGADITELDGISGEAARQQMLRGQDVFARLAALPVVVVAAVNGVAFGGGLELAMAADLRFAARHARLGQPEITLENLPGWGGTQRLPRLVGRGRATEMILTGDPVDADQALAIGLVEHVVDDPLAAAVGFAGRVAERSPTAVRGAKQAIAVGLDAGIAAGSLVEADAVAACCETEEQRAAVRAFLTRPRRTAPSP
jgi:enoyl-CoA hydratase